MEDARPSLAEVMGASKRVAQRTLDIGANRLELVLLELHEERERLMLSIIMALGVAALAFLAGMAFTLAIMVLLWENHAAIALSLLTAVYAVAAAILYTKLMRMQRDCEMFTATLDQLRKDRECLARNH